MRLKATGPVAKARLKFPQSRWRKFLICMACSKEVGFRLLATV